MFGPILSQLRFVPKGSFISLLPRARRTVHGRGEDRLLIDDAETRDGNFLLNVLVDFLFSYQGF